MRKTTECFLFLRGADRGDGCDGELIGALVHLMSGVPLDPMPAHVVLAEREALPLLARGAAMRFLLTRLVDWLNVPAGALVQPKDPLEYFRKLRFHQKAASVRDYGLPAEGSHA